MFLFFPLRMLERRDYAITAPSVADRAARGDVIAKARLFDRRRTGRKIGQRGTRANSTRMLMLYSNSLCLHILRSLGVPTYHLILQVGRRR